MRCLPLIVLCFVPMAFLAGLLEFAAIQPAADAAIAIAPDPGDYGAGEADDGGFADALVGFAALPAPANAGAGANHLLDGLANLANLPAVKPRAHYAQRSIELCTYANECE